MKRKGQPEDKRLQVRAKWRTILKVRRQCVEIMSRKKRFKHLGLSKSNKRRFHIVILINLIGFAWIFLESWVENGN